MDTKAKLLLIFIFATYENLDIVTSREAAKPCANNDKLTLCQCLAYDDRPDNHRELQCNGIDAGQFYKEFGELYDETFFRIQIRNSDFSNIDALSAERLSPSLDTLQFDTANLNSGNIPRLIEGMDNLKHLLIDNNQNPLDITRETFPEDVPIEVLDLNKNGLTDNSISPDALENIQHTLKVLRIRDNKLTRLPEAIKNLHTLETLDVTNNQIDMRSNASVDILTSLPNFKSVNINKIDCTCSTLNDGFITLVRKKQMSDIVCTEPQKFAGKHVVHINYEKDCDGGCGSVKLSVLALLMTLLLLYFK